MTACNAEYNESGNYDKHTHRCFKTPEHLADTNPWKDHHYCHCGYIWNDAQTAKAESRCTRRIETYSNTVAPFIVRCPHCLNQDAEIQKLSDLVDVLRADEAEFRHTYETEIPGPFEGWERQWCRCKTCRNIAYYDYQSYSLSTPVRTLPCGHGTTERFMDSITHITEAQAKYWLRTQK